MSQFIGKRGRHYFQFPLCALAFGRTVEERLRAIVGYCVVNQGAKRWHRSSALQREGYLAGWRGDVRLRRLENLDSETQCCILAGLDLLAVSSPHPKDLVPLCSGLRSFIKSFEAAHGRSPLVRLRTSLVFEARDGNGISYEELAVLAAIYSCIGRKQGPVRITQDVIRCRALGCKSPKVMRTNLRCRSDHAKPLTVWQLRRLIRRLRARKFFARATFGRRLTYYSHRMSEKALRTAIIERKTYQSLHDLVQAKADEEMTAIIRNRRALTAGKPPPCPDYGSSSASLETSEPGLYA